MYPKFIVLVHIWAQFILRKTKILPKNKISAKTTSLALSDNVSPRSQTNHRILAILIEKIQSFVVVFLNAKKGQKSSKMYDLSLWLLKIPIYVMQNSQMIDVNITHHLNYTNIIYNICRTHNPPFLIYFKENQKSQFFFCFFQFSLKFQFLLAQKPDLLFFI